MVFLDDSKESFPVDEINEEELREERRRTGRYVATGTAIFLSLLGLNQSIARGSPEYAALFLPALAMFLFVLWKIRSSKKEEQPESPLIEIQLTETEPKEECKSEKKKRSFRRNSRFMFSRSYSVA